MGRQAPLAEARAARASRGAGVLPVPPRAADEALPSLDRLTRATRIAHCRDPMLFLRRSRLTALVRRDSKRSQPCQLNSQRTARRSWSKSAGLASAGAA